MTTEDIFKVIKTLRNFIKYHKCQANYAKKLEEISLRTNKKIKIVFLVRENQKWSYQSIYESLESDPRFETIVLVSLLKLSHDGKDKTRNNLEENYKFFKSKGINVDYAYQNGDYIDLKLFSPDIVFYDQPWDLPQIHEPDYVSNFALTCYVPYGFGVLDFKKDYTEKFHKLLYKMFVEHEETKKRYIKYNRNNGNNCVISGQPKLDTYFEPESRNPQEIWKDSSKFKIIYAPHHSLDKNGLNYATFKNNGKFILELAQRHPETTWVFKPHPRFKYALLRNNIMTEEEIEQYYEKWQNIGKICTDGNYFDIFKSSDILLTDCCSFLAEYSPTGKPIVQIKNHSKPKIEFNTIGKRILDGCYVIEENSEIERAIEQLITGDDSKQNIRKRVCNEIFDFSQKSADKIVGYIKEIAERRV